MAATQIKRGAFEGAIDDLEAALYTPIELLDPNSNAARPCYIKLEAKLKRIMEELMKTSTSAESTYASASLEFITYF
jgi:hypothetical protein